jgi:plastocyanin
MLRKFAALGTAVVAAALVACGTHGAGSGLVPETNPVTLPAIDGDLTISAKLPARTIGEELPSAGLGTIHMPSWHTTVGGFTQTRFSQTLAFPPGTRITIRNLSKTTPHTLNVIKVISGPPASFPKSPALSTTARGHGKLAAGFASGIIAPGKSIHITLSKAGIYLIGCAFHYHEGMRDIIRVGPKAKPGPQATPPSTSTPTPGPSGQPSPSSYPSGYSY